MTLSQRNYVRTLDKMVGNLSAYLTAAADYTERVEHYDKAYAKRLEERVSKLHVELAEIADWAKVNLPSPPDANGH